MFMEKARGVDRAKPVGRNVSALCFAVIGAAILGAPSVHAATFTVANNNDSGDGSLRAAVTQANATAGADTIGFASSVGNPILLKSALPTLSGALIISGPGVRNLSVARDSTTQFRIFTTATDSTVTIAGLNIVGGDVSALDSEDNLVDSSLGGNILNLGTLTIRECTVFRGKASSGGGVLNNGGTLNIISSSITGNDSTADGTGAGVANAGTLNITNSSITNNDAVDDGGGIFHLTGTMTIENSTISGNECVSGGGGIITGGSDAPASQLVARISNSVISNNKSYNSAGGIDISDGSMTITNTTFSGNTAGSTDGVNRGSGGAIFNRRATLTITGSTFSANSANNGGAISNSVGALTITNSTFSGNSANSGAAIGGGDGAITIASSTITLNKSGVGAGIFGRARLSNSIVSGNDGPDVQGASTSGGYNLIGNVRDGATFTATGDRTGISDPKLGPLADNGGPTFTHLPQAGSPAIDAGDTPLTADQRGQSRPKGTRDDIGAVESGATASGSVLSIANAGAVKEGNIVSGVAKFVVTLTPAATAEVRVGYRAQNGTAIEDQDFAKIPANAQIVFAPGETSKTIEVRIVADDIVEPNETFAIQLITPQNATINPQAATGTATIVDDDTAALTLSIIPGTFSEAAGATAARGVVSRNSSTTAALTVNLSSNNTAKVTVPATVTIPAGQTSANFNLSAVDNTIVDGSKVVAIGATSTGFEAASINVTVTDNDSTTPTPTPTSIPTPNQPPVAQNQSISTKAGTPRAITLGATDANNDVLTFSLVTQPANGTLSGNGANVTYTPKAGFAGTDSFTFKANDGQADSNIATITVQVLADSPPPTNQKVQAVNDSYNLILGRGGQAQNAGVALWNDDIFRIAARGVLANDRALPGRRLSARLTRGPQNGRLQFNADGSFDYQPSSGFAGTDEFSYTLSDGQNTDTARVRLIILDRRAPQLRFDTPRDSATVSAVNAIDGRVRDRESGVKAVSVLWRREADGAFWNGLAWIDKATPLIAKAVGTNWKYEGDLPAAGDNRETDLLDGEYAMQVTAIDNAGNTSRLLIRFAIGSAAPESPELSEVRLSSAGASVEQGAVVLRFTGALNTISASDIMNYVVTIIGIETEIGAANYANNVVVLSGLDLSADEEIELRIQGLHDAMGKPLSGGNIRLNAR